MYKKLTSSKKLSLSRETVRNLDTDDLGAVGGGAAGGAAAAQRIAGKSRRGLVHRQSRKCWWTKC